MTTTEIAQEILRLLEERDVDPVGVIFRNDSGEVRLDASRPEPSNPWIEVFHRQIADLAGDTSHREHLNVHIPGEIGEVLWRFRQLLEP